MTYGVLVDPTAPAHSSDRPTTRPSSCRRGPRRIDANPRGPARSLQKEHPLASSHLPKPIRFDGDTWLCMRNDPTAPKAIIRRFRDVKHGAVFLVIRWALDPAEQQLMASAPSLERANELVRFDPPRGTAPTFAGYPHATTRDAG